MQGARGVAVNQSKKTDGLSPILTEVTGLFSISQPWQIYLPRPSWPARRDWSKTHQFYSFSIGLPLEVPSKMARREGPSSPPRTRRHQHSFAGFPPNNDA
jgi:hypothetical protein